MAITCQTTETTMPIWQLFSFFSFISPLPVLWLGLGNGFTSAYKASAIAVVFVTIAKLIGAPLNLYLFFHQVVLILTIVHFSLLSRKTESGIEWFPAGQVLAYIIWISVGAIIAFTFFMTDPPFSEELLRKNAKAFSNTPIQAEEMYNDMVNLLRFYPGILANTSVILVVGNAIFAQRLLNRQKQNIRPNETFQPASLPLAYLWVVVVATAVIILGMRNATSVNILSVLCVGFVIAGFSFVHEIRRMYKLSTISLVVFYVVVVLFWWLIVLVALLGLLEPWLRQHLKVLGNFKK